MKRCVALLLSALMLSALCACGGDAAPTASSEKSLYEHGLEVIEVMAEMTRLESYVKT